MLIVALTFGIMISSTYALGRIHQWYRHGEMRDKAYRSGYDKASHALLNMVQNANRRPAQALVPQSRTDVPFIPGQDRDHFDMQTSVRNIAPVGRNIAPAGRDVGAGRRRLPAELSDAVRW